MTRFLIYCFVLILCSTRVDSATNLDVRNLLNELFTIRDYDTRVRPITNQTDPLVVFVEYFLYGVNDVNEVEQRLTTTGYLEIVWQDEFLSWDPLSYGGLEYVYIPQGNVWKPDISLQNGFENLEELGSKFIQVYVTSDGYILWKPFQIFDSKCNLNPTYFPLDQQTCHLDFVVWSLDIDDVTLSVGDEGINMNEALESNGQWEVVSSSSTAETETTETKVRFSINMKRKPLFVIINIIIPIILLSVLNIFTFQIPAEMGERMGYTITVWLAFAVFLTIVSASLPKSSDTVPVLSVYIMIQLGIGTLTVLVSAIESRIVCRSEDHPASWFLRRLALLIRPNSVRPKELKEKFEMDVHWKEGIAALDMLLFCVLFLILIITTITIMMIAKYAS